MNTTFGLRALCRVVTVNQEAFSSLTGETKKKKSSPVSRLTTDSAWQYCFKSITPTKYDNTKCWVWAAATSRLLSTWVQQNYKMRYIIDALTTDALPSVVHCVPLSSITSFYLSLLLLLTPTLLTNELPGWGWRLSILPISAILQVLLQMK